MTQAIRIPLTQTSKTAPPGDARRWWVRVLNTLLIMLLAVLVVMVIRMVAPLTHGMVLQSVRVSGEFHQLRREELSLLLAAQIRGGQMGLDIEKVRRAAEQSPWVESARVSRVWPDGLLVQVSERKPVARWGSESYISASGAVFTPAALTTIGDLPILFGPADHASYVMDQFRAMNAILKPLSMRIVELQLTDRMSWMMRLDNGLIIVVDQQEMLSKMQRFTRLYEKQLAPDVGRIASIDLRYRNGAAVAWKH